MPITVSLDPARQDLDAIHRMLAATYWSPGIRREVVAEALRNSITAVAIDEATGATVGMARVVTDRATFAWLCDARAISAEHLGRQDSYRSARTGRRLGIGDDIDGFKLIGVGPDEWQVREVRTRFAADDGFDLTNSSIRMDRLVVRDPTEDGLNLSSSRIEVRRSLELDVGKTRERDRDIIDLEVDDGGSIVELPRGCRVKVRGVFGDQAQLASRDMPRPDTRADYETPYRYDGRLRRDAVVFSLTED